MKSKYASLSIVALAVLGLLAPILVENANAIGCQGTCYVQTNVANVPTSDATITIRLDNSTLFTLPHLFPLPNGTRHSLEVMTVSVRGASGTRYVFHQWEQCGNQWASGTNPMLSNLIALANYTTPCPSQYNGPLTARFDSYPPVGCTGNCNVQATTNVPASDATVYVRLDGTTYYTFPHTFSYANGTVHTLEVMNTTLTGASGARYVWTQWTQGSSQYSTTLITIQFIGNYTFVAQFDKQFQLTVKFTDASGLPVNPPSSVTLQSGTSTIILDPSTYSNRWTSALIWNVVNATWEGYPMAAFVQTIDLTTGSGGARSIQLKAYMATISVVDQSNNPLSGAKLTVILSNQTSTVLTTDSKGIAQLGRVPAGAYSVQVTYQNQAMGRWSADASQTPNYKIQLSVGGAAPASQTTAVVLLAVFGIAFVLILLAIKVRKPAPPPVVN